MALKSTRKAAKMAMIPSFLIHKLTPKIFLQLVFLYEKYFTLSTRRDGATRQENKDDDIL